MSPGHVSMPNKERTNVDVTLSPSKETCHSSLYDPLLGAEKREEASLSPGKPRHLADVPSSALFTEVKLLSIPVIDEEVEAQRDSTTCPTSHD